MNSAATSTLSDIRELLKQARCESYLEDLGGDTDAYLRLVQQKLQSFCTEYERMFRETPNIAELLRRNQEKGATFIQWLAGEELSTDLTIMIWRILSGAEVLSLSYQYHKDHDSVLEIEIEPLPGSPNGATPERYRSTSVFDFHLLSEFRMIGFNGKPYLFGSFRPVA
ncbi:MAG TPA: hypothetical protein VGM05_26355 [Planctomycetaceae bacterium]|jgi:hypothetical protein